MSRRTATAAVGLGAVTSLAILVIACGSSANSSTDPIATTDAAPADSESAAAPTAANELLPGFAPEGRTGAPGLGRGTRFVPLDNPEYVSASEATFLTPDDRVLGVAIGGESRAYPISMMTFHHVANDELAGLPVLVTF